MKVRNDAKKAWAYALERQAAEPTAQHFPVGPYMSPDYLLELVREHGNVIVRERALRELWKGGHTDQLSAVAQDGIEPYASHARIGLDRPSANGDSPGFFVESDDPMCF